jgi:hypothetical protein
MGRKAFLVRRAAAQRSSPRSRPAAPRRRVRSAAGASRARCGFQCHHLVSCAGGGSSGYPQQKALFGENLLRFAAGEPLLNICRGAAGM